MDNELILDMLKRARDVAQNAYAPYSQFHVGCVVLLENQQMIGGVNVENASFPVGLCAERSAMAQVVSCGWQHQIKAVAIVTNSSRPGAPCGMCRQFLQEFLHNDIPIILGNYSNEWVLTSISELLPYAFNKKYLAKDFL